MFDAIVVGGGPAGLSAALSLGRGRRRVLVASAGAPRNAAAAAAHNVFTRDGTPPLELIRTGRDQLDPYDVRFEEDWAIGAESIGEGFKVVFASGAHAETRGLVLATGVRDVLPDIPGLSDLWGGGVFHCPYCHGWEVAGRPLAVYAQGLPSERVLQLCRLIRGWSDDIVLFTDGQSTLTEAEAGRIERSGIVIEREPVERLAGSGGELAAVVLKGGREVPRGGMLISPPQELRSDLAHRLGCPLEPDGRVAAGIAGRTEVPGVFVAGDAGPGMQSVASAIASGSLAGAMLNHDLLDEL